MATQINTWEVIVALYQESLWLVCVINWLEKQTINFLHSGMFIVGKLMVCVCIVNKPPALCPSSEVSMCLQLSLCDS